MDYAQWNRDLVDDAAARLAGSMVAGTDIDRIALNRRAVTSLDTSVSHKVDQWAVADQKRSGRCWIFAGLNSLRGAVMARHGIEDFEFSQAYVHFYDKLEKANYFLSAMFDLRERPLDDRTVSHLLATPLEDGGQWNMFVSVVDKYGVVPKYVMPETHSSSHTAKLNRDLLSVLRRGTVLLREAPEGEAARVRGEVLGDVYRILVIHLGVPPERFIWQYRDKEGVFHREGEVSPREFARRYLPDDLGDYVCVVHDPRHDYYARYTVEHLGNVVGAGPVTYLNAPVGVLKAAAARAVAEGLPVWFGCETTRQAERETGVWAADLYDYEAVYGVEMGMTKEQRLRTGESLMEHAMVFTGVDLDEEGAPRRWRVENSWGAEKADKGFWTMDDSWFDPYVFEIAVPPRFLPAEVLAAGEDEPIVLPAWDPMGALATRR
ncbi:C1 family peptidase [Corynebacterium sp. zg-331]|uniref:C1 family peptidase n=1 Tax=unclassified Corynebacterium TaxID=2624378 RepID=UPI00128BAA68|nr:MULTISPECIES: C1 family peptidase [unclassified Corynebacterium]MBC3185654.1 C1 family peptidase [Corynebacterium sp. zg-331]MPV52148.1 aminopeptidase [Corynebacterium sp. zg331]